MPPRSRKPLSKKDPNIDISAKSSVSKHSVTFKDQVHQMEAKPEPTLNETNEVELLRAQVEDLTAKLEAATIEKKKDVKPTIVSNPFGGNTTITEQDIDAVKTIDGEFQDSFIVSASTMVGPPPKRPPTAYNRFQSDLRSQVRNENPDFASHQVTSKIAELWRDLKESDRLEYESKCAADREKFETEKNIYDAKVAAIEEERNAVSWMQEQIKQKRAMEMYEAHIKEQSEKNEKSNFLNEEIKKPKNPRNAFTFYQMKRHEEMSKHAEKDGKPKPNDANNIISDEWKGLQISRRKKDKAIVKECNNLCSEDHERFEREMEIFKTELETKEKLKLEQKQAFKQRAVEMYQAQKKEREELFSLRKLQAEQKKVEKEEKASIKAAKKAAKEQKALLPKRPRNAYALFFSEKTKDANVRSKSDAEGVSVAGIVGAMWRELTDDGKKPYSDLAAADRIRYENEMANLKQ